MTEQHTALGAQRRQSPTVLIIGAGMTGILLAIRLREAGINRVILLEKGASVGGTWRENSYPGVACDVPGHAYTYSFEANPNWSRFFAPGAEIHRYFIDVAHKYGIHPLIRFNEAAIACHYENGVWRVETSNGDTLQADLLYAATGMLHQPLVPDFPGLDGFEGISMHSAQWDHSVELAGKRIGVIGTGSSGAQLAPELIALPGTEVSVFQRTPHWVIKVADKPYSEADRQRFIARPAAMQRVKKLALFIYAHGTTVLTGDGPLHRLAHRAMAGNARRYLRRSVKDPVLRAKLTPSDTFGCKRVVMNATFYDAIQQPNAQLVTAAIEQFEKGGIRTADGGFHPLDVAVFATGFDPTAYMRPMTFFGRGGLSIEEAWQSKIGAYRSMFVPGFPNFFLMLGPNSPIGNNSVIAMSEVQAAFALKMVQHWQAGRIETIEARPEAMQDWNAMLREKMAHTVWASGCQSWYLDSDGDPLTWPDSWKSWVVAMQEPLLTDFYSAEPQLGSGEQSSQAISA